MLTASWNSLNTILIVTNRVTECLSLYQLYSLVITWLLAAAAPAAAQHRETRSDHILLAQEKIQIQISKYHVYWTWIAFTPLESWKILTETVLSQGPSVRSWDIFYPGVPSWRTNIWGGCHVNAHILCVSGHGEKRWFSPELCLQRSGFIFGCSSHVGRAGRVRSTHGKNEELVRWIHWKFGAESGK